MKQLVLVRVLMLTLMIFVLFFALPVAVAWHYREYDVIASFVLPGAAVMVLGILCAFVTRSRHTSLRLKQALLIVPLSWFLMSVVGALPYVISGAIPNFADALFETASGLTTTGASVVTEVESLPKAILFWRALTHWIGGMGIVVLTVAVFPMLGLGGNMLLAAETTGPALEKITSRVTHMAKIYWFIYFGLTVLQTALLMFSGMSWFDATTHAFSTIATGGFSVYNNNLIGQPMDIKIIVTVFMALAGINFTLFFLLLTFNLRALFRDSELRLYLFVIVAATALIAVDLLRQTGEALGPAFADGAFQVVSILTTTGFASVDFARWPYFAQTVLFLLMFIGGSAGSTAGGVKVVRVLVTAKYILRELIKVFTPFKVQRIALNRRGLSEEYVRLVLLFVGSYAFILLLTTFVIAFGNYDILTSFTTALSAIGNIGPGFGGIGALGDYSFFPAWIKTFLSLVMITGRLELFAVLIVFSPRFWR